MIRTKLLGAGAALLLGAGTALAAPAVSRSDLNVRSGPGTEHSVVGVIQAGETVDVMGRNGSWCQVEFDGGSGFASCSYLQMASGAPNAGVVVEAPAYDPYDYYDYGYSHGPSVGIGIYSGPRFGHRHGWHGDRNSWRGRSAWQGRGDWQGRGNWQGRSDRGNRMGNAGRGPERTGMGRAGSVSPQVSAPAGMSRGGGAPSVGAPAGGGIMRGGLEGSPRR